MSADIGFLSLFGMMLTWSMRITCIWRVKGI